MAENEGIIARALARAKTEGGITLQTKLRKLIVDRNIPIISSSADVEVMDHLGHGAFGYVELIRYHKKLYAHKRALHKTSSQKISILEEGLKLSDIAEYHPNIQHLYFINLDTFGLVIDYCNNGALDDYVKEKTSSYTLSNVVNWAYQLADALDFLHSRKLVHRDVKMQNILLKDNYQVLVLADYGTATEIGKALMTNNVGTPITMAPEVFERNLYTEQCDTYSWAIVCWQLICKQIFPYGNRSKIFLMSVVRDKLRPPKLENTPKIFIALLYRSWHSDPDERPSLRVIKRILNVILKILPKESQVINEEGATQLKDQWVNEVKLPEKYLPTEPRLDNEESMNIYQQHLAVMERTIRIKQSIIELEKKKSKFERYCLLRNENEALQMEIDRLRADYASEGNQCGKQ